MSADHALRVTTPGDREIVLARAFDAPAGLVYEAMTTPHLLTRWYGARGWNLVSCEVDLRVGGSWRFVSRGVGESYDRLDDVLAELTQPDKEMHP